MPEISDQQLSLLTNAYKLLSELDQSQDTSRSFHALVKKVRPNTQTPEDIATPFVTEVKNEIKEVRELVSKRFQEEDDAKIDRELNAAWNSLKKDGMTDEAKSEVVKLMKDRKIADPEAAFALYRRQNPPAPTLPASPGDNRWGSISEAMQSSKDLFTDPDGWARREAAKVLQESKQLINAA